MWVVDRDFTDWDGVRIKAGTKFDKLVRRGKPPGMVHFYNLITGSTTVAVYQGMPPVSRVQEKIQCAES